MSNSIPIYVQYGYCSGKSDSTHRYTVPDMASYGKDNCIQNTSLSLDQIARNNNQITGLLDKAFLNNANNTGSLDYFKGNYGSVNHQENVQSIKVQNNSYIEKACRSMNIYPDTFLNVYFSDSNINHLRNQVVKKVKEITGKSKVGGSTSGVDIQTPNMEDFFVYMLNFYQNYKTDNGSICFIGIKKNESNIKADIIKLNTTVLQDYVNKMISQINMYIYYYRDASQLPEQHPLPVYTSMKGSRSLELNTGFTSGNSMQNSRFNQIGNVYNI